TSGGVRLGRVQWNPTDPITGVPTRRTYLELGDHLGSTSIVLEHATGELVERATHLPTGTPDADYRPARWNSFRADYRFTGKEEDVEVGLTYFGKRYLSAALGRWVSADPLAVHSPGEADLNLYAYVGGMMSQSVDSLGLDKVMVVVGDANPRIDQQVGDANLARFARQWAASQHEKMSDGRMIRTELGPGERHVVRVSWSADSAAMGKAYRDASRLAGEGGKIVHAVGHSGSGDGNRVDSSVDLAPDAARKGLRLGGERLRRAEAALVKHGNFKVTGEERSSTELLSAMGAAMRASGVARLELLTCRVGGSQDSILQDMANRTGVTVDAHRSYVGVNGPSPATVMHMREDKQTVVPGSESATMTPPAQATARPAPEQKWTRSAWARPCLRRVRSGVRRGSRLPPLKCPSVVPLGSPLPPLLHRPSNQPCSSTRRPLGWGTRTSSGLGSPAPAVVSSSATRSTSTLAPPHAVPFSSTRRFSGGRYGSRFEAGSCRRRARSCPA
ncbi:MAG: RHS repeat-associated core domain-containing protein, partial [Deltaproteobacteria bacterium]|nr:RHS repeat-associated core domain-containing protein [Deltaproteobacteria bacterium]